MTYQGYMALANDAGETLELVNSARVKAYTDNLAPSLGLRGCEDCEGLEEALGDTYSTPAEDFAPWYDPTDPATADFYGVYPLGFEGIDDSTRTIESAEVNGDGSVVVGSRFAGQDIRVTGMAFAKDEAALYAGVSWLNSALNGTEEGRCFGDRLNVFSSCPPVQDLPPDFATPYTLNPSTPVATNVVNDPRATQAARWAALGGVSAPETMITGAVDGPVMPDGVQATTYARYTISATVAGNALFGYDMGSAMLPVVPSGANIAFAIYVRSSTAVANISVRKDGLLAGVGSGTAQASPSSSLPANTWQLRSLVVVNNANFDQVRIMAQFPAGSQSVGQVIDVTCAMLVIDSATVPPYFDGSTVDTTSFLYGWNGGTNNSTSSKVDATSLIAEAANWTTTSGTITADTTGVNFAWTAGDPLHTACRTVTGLIPGEQYQLRLRPEAFGNYYVSMGRDCAERYTNMIRVPRLNGLTMTLNGSTSVDTYPQTGGPDGGSFFSRLVVVPNSTSPMSMSLGTAIGTGGIPVSPDTIYTISWYAQKLGLGGPASRIDYNWYTSAGVLITANNGTGMSPAASWQRFSQTVTSPPTAAFLHINLVWTGIAVAGQTLNTAMAMLNEGSTALPYIDGNYPDSHWLGAAGGSASMVERNVDYQTIFGWTTGHEPPTEPTVLDFTANSGTMYLSIQSLGVSGAPPTTSLQVQQASVRRTARPGVVTFGTGNDAVPPSDGWTHVAPSSMRVDWFLLQSSIRTTASLPVGGSASYTAAHGPSRTLFGLIPGSRYRLMVEFQASWNATGATAGAALSPNVTISNSTGVAVTYTNDNVGTFQYFWVVEFTATATSALLGFHPGSTLAVGTQGSVTWQFDEYMVEEILATDTVPPQPGRNEQRTMYEVKASTGATITNLRRAPCGVMAQVTYGLRAGQPFKYRNPAFAGGLPTGASTQVADIPCSDDGLPQLINFAYNPSVEVNATDWLAGGSGTITQGRVASASARVGGFVFQATAPATAGNKVQTVTAYYNLASVTGGPIPLGGDTITVSLWVRTIAATWNGIHPWIINLTLTGFPTVQATGNVNITVANQWYRIQGTFTLPFNVPLSLIEAQVQTPAAIANGGGIQIDGYMVERGAVATDPWDETFPNTEWSATPYSSALLRDQPAVDISADPDCPTPPLPPAPPQIDDSCVDDPLTYNRTVVSILETAVPRNLTAYPLITLTAGAVPVRQARIRFWENPGNLTIDQVDPCSYDGEIIVSYLAAGATMVIDGVLQEATVSLTGFDSQNANHTLYGPDGGPVDWPELTGGIPYLVTLELDSAGNYSDTLMTIDLVVRD